MNETIDPPLKWHGGKHYFAAKFIELMPHHIHYVEPYFGGGAVLLAKNPEGFSEVANDINGELSNFWNVLRCPTEFEQLKRFFDATPFSQKLFDRIGTEISEGTPVDRAFRFFVRCRQSMAGRMKCFAPLTRNRTRRAMNEQASAWLNAIEGLPAVHERLKRVVILNRPALEVIRQQDGPNTFFYLDPPYLHETRTAKKVYEFEMSGSDHGELLDALLKIEGKFMLSGYRSALYDNHAAVYGWNRNDFPTPNHSASGAEKREMVECVWMNY